MSDARIRRLEQAYRADPTEANRLAWLHAKEAGSEGVEPPPELAGKRIMVRGYLPRHWPKHYREKGPLQELEARGAVLVKKLDESVEILCVGGARQKGRAALLREGQALVPRVTMVDEQGLNELLRPDLRGKTFVFAGGFECAPGAAGPAHMVEALGARVAPKVDETTDYFVVGPRRAKGKTALERGADLVKAAGHDFARYDEETFVSLLACFPVRAEESLVDMAGLLVQLQKEAEGPRLKKAVKMLTKKPLTLKVEVKERQLRGIVPSQTYGGGYASFLSDDGRYFCGEPSTYEKGTVHECGGLRGKPCKHLLALTVGLAGSGVLDPATAAAWLTRACAKKPLSDEDAAPIVLAVNKEAGSEGWQKVVTDPAVFKG